VSAVGIQQSSFCGGKAMKIKAIGFVDCALHALLLFLVVSSLVVIGSMNVWGQGNNDDEEHQHDARHGNVLTQHNDKSRTGVNPDETILTPSDVNVNNFGKLFTNSVDGAVYAQPLYVAKVKIGDGKPHNVVYVATENNSVYAFDADSAGITYWHKNFGLPWNPAPCGDLIPVVGITGTPVIDLDSNTLYVDTKLGSGLNQTTGTHQLHALSIFDGSEKFGGPVTVSPNNFNGTTQAQRPGLLLSHGVVYAAYGSHCDSGLYHGFLLGFDAHTLAPLYTFNVTPTGTQGAIWQSGTGPAMDRDGNIYVVTGNGTYDGISNFGESFLKLSDSLSVEDSFTPPNFADLNLHDQDLGSSGATLLVPPHFVIGIGKDGILHLVDRNDMGGLGGGAQAFQAAIKGDTAGMSPVYWNGPSKQYIFLGHAHTPTQSFEFKDNSIVTTPLGVGPITQNDRAGGMSLSANEDEDGILWDINSDSVVRAYDAVNFPLLLWDSTQNATRDSMGTYVKFVAPTISNGKVYVGTQNSLVVYGLLCEQGEDDRGCEHRQ
jgi:hypothetical protein